MNMSFFLTQSQVREGTKFVTRRGGWWGLTPGAVLWACEKCQGLKKGESITRIRQIKIIDVRSERLDCMLTDLDYGMKEVILEGFPDKTPQWFVQMYCKHNGCEPDNSIVRRIEFCYVDGLIPWQPKINLQLELF